MDLEVRVWIRRECMRRSCLFNMFLREWAFEAAREGKQADVSKRGQGIMGPRLPMIRGAFR